MLDAIFGAPQKTYRPYNAVTGKPYTGKNILTLETAAAKLDGLNDSRWLTFLQAKELGYKVKKGEHGTRIELWKFDTVENEEKEKRAPLIRYFTVFHASQIDGIPEEVKTC